MMEAHSHGDGVFMPRWVRPVIVGLAFLLAIGFGVVTWLILQRDQGLHQRQQLACQVQRLGGKPIGGVKCPPPKKKLPSKLTPTPAPTVTLSPGTRTTVIVIPSGGGASAHSAPQHTARPTRSPSARPTHTSSPSPTPSSCVHADGIASVCLTPPPASFYTATVWMWL